MRRFRQQWERSGALCCLFAVLASILTNCGCSTTSILSPATNVDMNARLKGREASIESSDGVILRGWDVCFTDTVVSWFDLTRTIESRIERTRLRRIKILVSQDHLLGAIEGFGFGGLGTFLTVGTLSGWQRSFDPDRKEMGSSELGLILALPGAVIGTIICAYAGHAYFEEYQFR
jgi:hypothetical protein